MGLFSKKTLGGGFMDVIRCDEQSYLIWKWRPEGTQKGNNRKENAIRWGSSLRVKEGSVAVFVYSQLDGTAQDYIMGPYDSVLETENLPVIASIVGLAYDGGTPFQAEVYFINLAEIIQVKFAVPFFDVYDPRFLDYGIPTAVRGTISFKITDFQEFIRLHRLDEFSLEDFQKQVHDAVIRYVKNIVANAPEEYGIPVVQLERKIGDINDIIEEKIGQRFYETFGVTVSAVDLSVIEVDKSSEGYRQLKAVTQDLTTATMQAKTDVEIKDMRASQKLGVLERAGKIVTGIKEDAYARHKKTQSENFAAYQTEAATEVGVAGAKGLGKMGANGGGNMGGGGFNPAGMMAGMAVGSTIGQNIARAMNKVMGGENAAATTQPVTPPPIPTVTYHVAVNGQATGPFDMVTLSQMYTANQFNKESLVWKAGMTQWSKAGEVEELATVFQAMPPIPRADGSGMKLD